MLMLLNTRASGTARHELLFLKFIVASQAVSIARKGWMAVGVESSGMKTEDEQAQCSASTNKIRWTDDMVKDVGSRLMIQ